MAHSQFSAWQKQVVSDLRKLAQTSDKTQGGDYLGTKLEYLGLRAEQYKIFVRKVENDLPADWEKCCKALWQIQIFETRILAVLLASRFQKQFNPVHWKLFSAWLKESAGWAMVDTLADSAFVPLLLRHPALAKKTDSWVNSKNLWVRRGSLVVFCKPVRKGFLSEYAFAHAKELIYDRDPMIVKAMSWLLRETSKNFRKQTELFLKQHELALSPLILREVRTKIKTGTKSGKSAR